MKKTTVTFVQTEYHLLLFINLLINEEERNIVNNHILYLPGKGKFRIPENINISSLNVEIRYISEEYKSNIPLNEKKKNILNQILSINPDKFIFFQELNLLLIILAQQWKKNNNTKIELYQDGFKPYARLKYNSIALMINSHKTNVWLRKNGFSIDSWLSPLWAHRYGYIKEIDNLYLTFPKAYNNWNKRTIKKIELLNFEKLKIQLNETFNWKDSIIPHKEDIILYMSQPMHDDGVFESQFIQKIINKFPTKKVYIKTHPLISKKKIDEYKKHPNINIIEEKIPAELIIMQLNNSIILSVGSTSMFLNNENCKFYYLYKIFKNDIKRLKRYAIKINPAPHIFLANSINDIDF